MTDLVKDVSLYSPMELAILKSLKPGKPVGVYHLKRAVYGRVDPKAIPRNWLIVVNGATRRLRDKLIENREAVRVVREKIEGKRAHETVLIGR